MPVTIAVPVQAYGQAAATLVSYSLLDPPGSAHSREPGHEHPGRQLQKCDTFQLAFNKRFRTGLFLQASYDYQWRNELRGNSSFTNTNTMNPSTSPLNSDTMPIGYYMDVNPAVGNRQTSTNWQGRAIARYEFKLSTSAWRPTCAQQSGSAY